MLYQNSYDSRISQISVSSSNRATSNCYTLYSRQNTEVFKVDTGTEVTVISQEIYESLGGPKQTLEKSSKKLYGPACQPLDMLGQFIAKLIHGLTH